MPHTPEDLWTNLPRLDHGEDITPLLSCRSVRIERIVSGPLREDRPDIERYDQSQDEWVLLVSGEAELEVDGQRVGLSAGQQRAVLGTWCHGGSDDVVPNAGWRGERDASRGDRYPGPRALGGVGPGADGRLDTRE